MTPVLTNLGENGAVVRAWYERTKLASGNGKVNTNSVYA